MGNERDPYDAMLKAQAAGHGGLSSHGIRMSDMHHYFEAQRARQQLPVILPIGDLLPFYAPSVPPQKGQISLSTYKTDAEINAEIEDGKRDMTMKAWFAGFAALGLVFAIATKNPKEADPSTPLPPQPVSAVPSHEQRMPLGTMYNAHVQYVLARTNFRTSLSSPEITRMGTDLAATLIKGQDGKSRRAYKTLSGETIYVQAAPLDEKGVLRSFICASKGGAVQDFVHTTVMPTPDGRGKIVLSNNVHDSTGQSIDMHARAMSMGSCQRAMELFRTNHGDMPEFRR